MEKEKVLESITKKLIKLGQKNIGFNGKFYTIPYFCVFLLKRFLHEDFVLMTNK